MAKSVGFAPDGTRVYVTGWSDDDLPKGFDFATIAYDATSGAEEWMTTYDSPGAGVDQAYSLAVAPDGNDVYVSGYGGDPYAEYLSVDYDAASGTQRHLFQYVDPGNSSDFAYASAVSPSGMLLFVTGGNRQNYSTHDYLTVAFAVG